jgi:replication initiation protein RepC
MRIHNSTTPFGRRSISLGQIGVQVQANSIPLGASTEKWRVFQHIREAREPLGATDRALAILNALLSFYPANDLTAEAGLIVWPSNDQLIARSNGMSPATLRRHLSVLVQCGLIIRRDSPNGKRFARKGWGGQIDQAFGFDLSPLVARAQEFEALAEGVKAEKRALRVSRERLTLLRRDIVKLMETGLEEGVPGDWSRYQGSYLETIARLPRNAARQVTDQIGDELEHLYVEIRQTLESFANSEKLNGNESQNERHIQNSNPEKHKDSEDRSRPKKEEAGEAFVDGNVQSLPKRDLPLGIVLDACPGLRDLSGGKPISNWRDFVDIAELARPMLGISSSAWAEALAVLGAREAAITLAAIYQKGDAIKSSGGYLRSLVDRAKDNKFSAWPMVMALLRAKLDREATVNAQPAPQMEQQRKPAVAISPSLLKNLSKPR